VTPARFPWLWLPAAALFAALLGCGDDKPAPSPPTRPSSGKTTVAAPKAAPPDKALAAREHALIARLTEKPDDLDATLQLANHYYDTQRPELAIPGYVEVLKHRPDNPSVRTDLGTCYRNLGRFREAKAEYERVIQKNPGHIQATYNLAVVAEELGDLLRAAELWERVAGMAPGTPAAAESLRHAAAARAAAAKAAPTPKKKEAPE
jgi:tetratricopeptide (TPR) repeat protein